MVHVTVYLNDKPTKDLMLADRMIVTSLSTAVIEALKREFEGKRDLIIVIRYQGESISKLKGQLWVDSPVIENHKVVNRFLYDNGFQDYLSLSSVM